MAGHRHVARMGSAPRLVSVFTVGDVSRRNPGRLLKSGVWCYRLAGSVIHYSENGRTRVKMEEYS